MSLLQSLKARDRVFDFMAPEASPVDVRHGPILYMEDVTVSFDGFKAINNLNLTIDDGELRCIIGPNGAGKTTMMDIITGKTRPTEGSVWFGSRHNLLQMNEPEIASLGIGRKFQKPTVFEALSVFDNLELAMAADKRIFPTLERFMSMVQSGYLPVLRPGNYAFGRSEQLSDGRIQWEVLIDGPDGKGYTATYFMERQEDGTWKVDAVTLRRGAPGMT